MTATYWDLLGTFANRGGASFEAELVSFEGRRIPEGRDFDAGHRPAEGCRACCCWTRRQATELAQRLQTAQCRVANLEDKPYTTRPYPPFTTSTLQQEANRKYGFTARHTMQVAQSLYENGHITYMRTDSTTLASVAVEAARQLVASQYGPEYLSPAPRVYQTKVKNAQEAHEAIRPAGHPFEFPESLRGRLSPDEFKLYDLVWKRTVASQMADARGHRVTVTIEAEGAIFHGGGQDDRVCGISAGLRRRLRRSGGRSGRSRRCLAGGCGRASRSIASRSRPKSHTTQPPNRYSEASLTRALEEMGIGRPSTYASIIDTILARDYVFKLKRGNVLVPTWLRLPCRNCWRPTCPTWSTTSSPPTMEDELDAISRGEMGHLDYLQTFYFGNEHPGLKQLLENKQTEIDARDVCRISLGTPPAKARPRRRFSSASAAMGRFWNRPAAAPACPTACRPTN